METNIITKIELFDLMRCFFCDPDKYNKLTQSAKKPHLFMWSRFMSIRYPVAMHNVGMVSDVRIMDELQKKFCVKGGQYPKWLYTSNQGGKSETAKPIISKFDREILDMFMKLRNCEYKSLLIMQEMFPSLLESELNSIKESLEAEVSKTKMKKKNDNKK